VACAAKTPALNPENFFVHGCLMLYHDGIPEVTVQFLEAVGEAADVISNELDASDGKIQRHDDWQYVQVCWRTRQMCVAITQTLKYSDTCIQRL
jgi:hypothetical protein